MNLKFQPAELKRLRKNREKELEATRERMEKHKHSIAACERSIERTNQDIAEIDAMIVEAENGQ